MANVWEFSPDAGTTKYDITDLQGRDDIDGINLLDVTLSELKARNTRGTWNGSAYTFNGITYTINADNTVSLNGTASDASYLTYTNRISAPLKLETNRYVLSGGYSDDCYIMLGKTYNGAWYEIGRATGDNDVIFDALDTENYGVELTVSSGQILSNVVVKPMLTDAKYAGIPYRPYNQQSIQHQINDITGVTGVRNWLPIEASTETNNGITYTVNKDNNGNVLSIHMSGTTTATSNFVLNNTYKLTVGDYVAVCKYTGTTNGQYPIVTNTLYNSDGTQKTNDYAVVTANNPKTAFSITENEYLSSFRIYIPNGRTVDCTVYFMIKLASDPDDTYVPYAMTNRELTENVIPQTNGIFSKIGNIVICQVGIWTNAADVTVPSDYRPSSLKYAVTEQRLSSNTSNRSVSRITISAQGVLTLDGSNDQFVGSFMYFI